MPQDISVVVITKNEEQRIDACLKALRAHFSNLYVVDSASADKTRDIARSYGARVIDFEWNGAYPKKYSWCLGHIDGLSDWVLFIDADEIISDELAREIKDLDFEAAGYFIRGRYKYGGYVLKYGLQNNKLCLLNRLKIKFPIVNDLDIEGMGEIEGHYQPVLRPGFEKEKIKYLKHALIHDTDIDGPAWELKHKRYANWEAAMDIRKAWPKDSLLSRRILKWIFKTLPFRSYAAFIHSYILKLGFLDGRAGFILARSRYRYYSMVSDARRDLKNQ